MDPIIAQSINQSVSWLWEQFGRQLFEKFAERAKHEAQWRRSVEKYLSSLYHRVEKVRVLGRLENQSLDGLYTEVNLINRITAEQRYGINQLQSISNPRREYTSSANRLNGISALQEYKKLFILGKPGAGKTTFLKWLALQAVQQKISQFPIFITLREMADDNPTLSTATEIIDFIIRWTEIHDIPNAKAFVTRLLRTGQALVLFDGLDEVMLADRQRSNLVNGLNQFVSQFSRCQIAITCRVSASEYAFEQFTYVEMADFYVPQIFEFIDKWFTHDLETAKRCREEMILSANKSIKELAQIPLLLTLLCVVYEAKGTFPLNRFQLYDEATDALLSRWDMLRNIHRDEFPYKLDTIEKQHLLANIAATLFQEDIYFIKEAYLLSLIEHHFVERTIQDSKAILLAIEAHHGLLVERAHKIHSFSHLTIQEYYTARYFLHVAEEQGLDDLMQYVGEERWREVFLLVAEMLDKTDLFFPQFLTALQIAATNNQAVNQFVNQLPRLDNSFLYRTHWYALQAISGIVVTLFGVALTLMGDGFEVQLRASILEVLAQAVTLADPKKLNAAVVKLLTETRAYSKILTTELKSVMVENHTAVVVPMMSFNILVAKARSLARGFTISSWFVLDINYEVGKAYLKIIEIAKTIESLNNTTIEEFSLPQPLENLHSSFVSIFASSEDAQQWLQFLATNKLFAECLQVNHVIDEVEWRERLFTIMS